jgi:hypothetical protein
MHFYFKYYPLFIYIIIIMYLNLHHTNILTLYISLHDFASFAVSFQHIKSPKDKKKYVLYIFILQYFHG